MVVLVDIKQVATLPSVSTVGEHELADVINYVLGVA